MLVAWVAPASSLELKKELCNKRLACDFVGFEAPEAYGGDTDEAVLAWPELSSMSEAQVANALDLPQ